MQSSTRVMLAMLILVLAAICFLNLTTDCSGDGRRKLKPSLWNLMENILHPEKPLSFEYFEYQIDRKGSVKITFLKLMPRSEPHNIYKCL